MSFSLPSICLKLSVIVRTSDSCELVIVVLVQAVLYLSVSPMALALFCFFQDWLVYVEEARQRL